MPVTANFSEKFYERLGHDLTEELVNHMNFIDQTYRTELRELNELNFVRFDAKIEQRAVLLDTKWDERFREVDRRFGELDAKWEQTFAKVDQRFGELDAKIDRAAAELRGAMTAGFAQCKADLIQWMFVFWASTAVTVIGTMIALVKL